MVVVLSAGVGVPDNMTSVVVVVFLPMCLAV